MRFVNVVLASSLSLLAACGGGGGGSHQGGYSCAYIPGAVTAVPVSGTCNSGCASSSPEAVADTNQRTFATVAVGIGQRTTSITDSYSGASFPAGSKVGALITFAGGASVNAITLTTYQGTVAEETMSGASLKSESTNGTTTADNYVSFVTTLAFDSLQMVVNATNGNQFSIYEFCGDS